MKLFITFLILSVHIVLSFCGSDFDYCSLNENLCEGNKHIACGTLESKVDKQDYTLLMERGNVTIAKLSDIEQNLLMNYLNSQRNKIALGQTLLPKGANLQKTVWDSELELLAKSLAEVQSLKGVEDFCFKRRNGQIVYGNIVAQENPKNTQEAIREIFEDLESNIQNENSTNVIKQVAFLTKMGCYFGYATVKYNESDHYMSGLSCVLDYGMDREIVGQLFEEGEPCSKCPNGLVCDTDFIGLCATK